MQILLTIAYDGTEYAGWQRQKNAVAVQQKLEEALQRTVGAVTLRSASRTDAGVHALGQRASFYVENLKIPFGKLPQVINAALPGDIAVTHAEYVPDEFNPRFDAVCKTYRYQIITAPNPIVGRFAAFVPRELDVAKMRLAAEFFVGRHDFAAFCAAGSSAKTTVRTIFGCDIVCDNEADTLSIHVTGDGFLYNMVRIIAGTLVYVGLGKLVPGDIPGIILSRDRARAGKTMPAKGLTLVEVKF